MTGNSCVLDTSVVIDAFRKNNTVAERLDGLTEVFVPVIVAGELYYGAYKSSDTIQNLHQIERFLQKCKLLYLDNTTALNYGKIKTALRQKGKPVPENDIWIAAVAQQYDLPLFTTDNHFNEIDDLKFF
jgi:tRNA(fMet)-specific endonuclease VapC